MNGQHSYQLQKDPRKSRIVRWAFASNRNDPPIKAFFRTTLRVLIIMGQEFFATHVTLRASALTFTIILSLVPLLAMSTAILKGLGSDDQLQTFVSRLIDQLDPAQDTGQTISTEQSPEATTAKSGTISITPVTQKTYLNKHLHETVDTIFDYVHNTNFAALGAFGIIGLLIAVVMVFSTMEEAMNSIWHTKKGRSLFRKIMDYLALLILLPISINIAIAGEAVLESPKMFSYITTVIPFPWLIQMLFKLLPFGFITLTLMMMYLFFPHVRVKTLPALCGAIFASVFWFIVQRGYIVLQIGVAKYNAIYGSFATVPLILIWIQLGWTFILLGAVLAHAIQNRNHYRLPGENTSPALTLQRTFDVILVVYQHFFKAQYITFKELIDTFPGETARDLEQVVDLLVQGGLLYKTKQNNITRLLPAKPAQTITAQEIIQLVFGSCRHGETVGASLSCQIIHKAEQTIPPKDFPLGYLQLNGKEFTALEAEKSV